MVSNIILNLILVQYYGHVGLAAATSISALLNALILYFFLIKQSIYKLHVNLYKMLFKVTLSVIIMSLYITYFDSNIDVYYESSMIERSLLIIKTIAISVAIYFLTLFMLGVRLKNL